MTLHEAIACLVMVAVVGAAWLAALAWALRPPLDDDELERAYLDELAPRRGTPPWRAGRGAYDHEGDAP